MAMHLKKKHRPENQANTNYFNLRLKIISY